MRGPSLRDLIIPIGMGGGAFVGILIAVLETRTNESFVRQSGDPGDAAAMMGVIYMFAGAALGMLFGVIAAVILYLKRRRLMQRR
jgi:uncharacterized protein involved in exopolysaccharide biosynthesis